MNILVLVGIEPWSFVQHVEEAVFIPAGCPHQVRNLKVCLLTFLLGIHTKDIKYTNRSCISCFFPKTSCLQ